MSSVSSSDRSRSVSPSRPCASPSPSSSSAAKRAILMGLSLEDTKRKSPEIVAPLPKRRRSSVAASSSDRSRSVSPSRQCASPSLLSSSAAKRAILMGLSLEDTKRKSPEIVAPLPKRERSSVSASSSDRSRSVSPSRPCASPSPSSSFAAKRAILMGLSLEDTKRKSPEIVAPLPKRQRSSVSASSSDRSRSVSPSRPCASPSPSSSSAAKRAILMGLSLEDTKRKSPEIVAPLPKRQACVVNQTRTNPLRLSANVLERIKAMDMSDEEVEELLEEEPWHIRRWIQEFQQQGRGCSTPLPISPTTTAGEALKESPGVACVRESSDAQSSLNVSSVDADVRPSTSGLMGTISRPVGGRKDQGSDFDSDFDDELNVEAAIGISGLASERRQIPDDDELDETARDVIHAVERAMDAEAERMLGVSNIFHWEEDFESFRGVPEVFSGPSPGALKDYDNPYDAFTDIWSNDIMEFIAQETNRYARQTIDAMKANGTLKPTTRLHQWSDTDADEIAVLFAVFMYMGIDSRSSQDEYWKANDYLEMPRFKELLSYGRFLLLNKFLHFADNSDVSQNLSHGEEFVSKKLAKIKPLISHLSSKFTALYNMHREIAIDESLTLFKGRLSFVQTIRSKAARFGIKSYELCESQTGYLYKFIIYTGKSDHSSAAVAPSEDLGGKTTKVVLDLLKGLEHRGHCVTMDNFYNSPSLTRYLKSLGFDCLGTLRVTHKHVPDDISKVPKNVEKGTIVARHCGDVSIVAWKDTKLVTMISTYHTDETYTGSKDGKALVKPVSVKDYNNTMGGVDLKDQKLSMYLLERKRVVKWYIKIFKRLLNVSIHNAFVMYTSSLRRRNKKALTHREFRYRLAKSLVDKHHHDTPAIREQIGEVTRLRRDVLHEPQYDSGKNTRKRCTVCYRQNITKLVHTRCDTCGVSLCFGTCWREWHSRRKLKGREPRGRRRSGIK